MKKTDTSEMFSSVEEANEWLDAIIEHSFDGIYITDGNANTIKANRAYETITGLKKSEVLGCNTVSYTHLSAHWEILKVNLKLSAGLRCV